MFQSLFRNNFRAQLIIPVAITLLVMIIAAITFTVVSQKKSSRLLNSQIEKSFSEIAGSVGEDLGKLSERFEGDLQKMQTEVSSMLATSSSETLKATALSMRMNIQGLWRQSGENLLQLLSVSSVNSIITKNYAALNTYVRSAHANKDVVFLFYKDSEGKPITRFLNRKNEILQSYLPQGKPDIEQIIQAGESDSNVLVLQETIQSDGETIGSVVLALDLTESIRESDAVSLQFDDLVETNSDRIDFLLGKESAKLNTTLQSVISDINGDIRARSDKTVEQVQNTSESISIQSRNLFIWGSVAGLFLVLGMLYLNARSILNLLGGQPAAMVDLARRVAKGDLTEDSYGSSVPGSLQEALFQMSSRLRSLIGNIVTEGRSLQATSTELALAAEDLTGGAEQSASRSDAVAAATEEMSANMDMVTHSSEQASQNVNLVATAMEEMAMAGQKIAQNTAKASSMTEEAVSYAAMSSEKVNQLGNAAREISKVTEVITEISEQTNLLALNATIEAARAGEAGKGFAVVANEIKELAKQTAQATGEIKAKIESIQSSTDDTVKEISQIGVVINNVNELVGTIATAAELQATTVNEVSLNVTEASSSINEVNENVFQASVVAKEIAKDIATVSQVSKEAKEGSLRLQESSHELKRVADKINGETSQFDLGASHKNIERVHQTTVVKALIRWSQNLSVGINSIDEQHKVLVNLINELYKQMHAGLGKEAVGKTLGRLIDYTAKHFKYEEKLFAEHRYPEQKAHQELHDKLVGQVVAFQEEFTRGEKDVSLELMEFLKEWLLTHIKKKDMAYGPYLRSRGVE
ncbi:bacteriohemerythrin [Desulforhopalus sp. IMCC35007]|uniref:bacteriohemerythrin n=1 Tax=Desulforhopalus sp. IMCC35007 TaxID=2569543 RepID=UPI0010AE447B|nr:bacteriohemerythrin [Desulforhopalus sp. IMCC35007]TKB08553.1 bacteriohemerythrin [Desulforhopalus sp. IMCC35007]